jgi:solute carrier family 25 carnitine/acylcarnitine transporter 20/29
VSTFAVYLAASATLTLYPLSGHPFDLTKVRLQTAPQGTYTGALDVVKKTLARDGLKGYLLSISTILKAHLPLIRLYRGMGPPLVGVTPIFAISFWGYDLGKKIVYAATPSRSSQQLSMAELASAGFFSAIPATLLAAPAERIKVVLQVWVRIRLMFAIILNMKA